MLGDTAEFCDADQSAWLMATRDPETGLLTGSLKSIDARHAYWIRSSTTWGLHLQIPPLDPLQIPPTIPVIGGEWNYVPVISLLSLEQIPAGTELDADGYLGTDWSRAFTFDRGQWVSIAPGQTPDGDPITPGDAVQIGKGYVALFTTDHVITP